MLLNNRKDIAGIRTISRSTIGEISSFILALALFFLTSSLTSIYAQQSVTPSAEIRLDTQQIRLGEPITMDIVLIADKNDSVTLPTIPDTLVQGVEVIGAEPLRKIEQDNEIIYTQRRVITSFDSGFYMLPSLTGYVNETPLITLPKRINVSSVVVDTTKVKLYDIKPVVEIPYTFIELLRMYWVYLLALLLLIGGFIWWKNSKKDEHTLQETPPELRIPAHIWALGRLKELDEKDYLSLHQYKMYYSTLTDILRTYLERRFEIQAMESTSYEILNELKGISQITNNARKEVENLLMQADLTKFAKFTPAIQDTHLFRKNVEEFVRITTPTESEQKGNAESDGREALHSQ